MKKLMKGLVFTIMSVFLIAGGAMATPVDGSNLQDILDGITVDGNSSIDVNTDQVADGLDSYWSLTASGAGIATLIIEVAGYAGINSLGVYDSADYTNQVELFAGPDSSGDKVFLSIDANGTVYSSSASTGVDFTGGSFGYYLTTPYYTFYSDTNMNDDGFDHMVAFQGNDDVVQLPSCQPGTWTDSEYILAWEDLYGGGDSDYNDMVLMVSNVEPAPVPEPATMLLLGTGLAGVAGVTRKKMSKKS